MKTGTPKPSRLRARIGSFRVGDAWRGLWSGLSAGASTPTPRTVPMSADEYETLSPEQRAKRSNRSLSTPARKADAAREALEAAMDAADELRSLITDGATQASIAAKHAEAIALAKAGLQSLGGCKCHGKETSHGSPRVSSKDTKTR